MAFLCRIDCCASWIFLICAVCWTLSQTSGSDVVVRATMYPQRNFTLNLNSDDNVTFTCVTKGGYPVWAVGRAACLEKDGCVSKQLQLEDHKHGSYAMTKGWMVEDLAYNESIIMITKKTRMLHGDLKIFCLAFSTEYYYETPPRTPQYYIFSYGPLNDLSQLELSLVNGFHVFSWKTPDVPSTVSVTYIVKVVNVNSSNDMLVDTNTTSPYISFYNVSENYGYNCSEVNMTVYYIAEADDGIWMSSATSKLENIPISPNLSPVNEDFSAIVELKPSRLSLKIFSPPADVCSKSFPVTHYIIAIADSENNRAEITHSPSRDDETHIAITVDNSDASFLAMNHIYTITVSACSTVTCHTSKHFTKYAAEIQNLSIRSSGRNVSLMCELVKSSGATGAGAIGGGSATALVVSIVIMIFIIAVVFFACKLHKHKSSTRVTERLEDSDTSCYEIDTSTSSLVTSTPESSRDQRHVFSRSISAPAGSVDLEANYKTSDPIEVIFCDNKICLKVNKPALRETAQKLFASKSVGASSSKMVESEPLIPLKFSGQFLKSTCFEPIEEENDLTKSLPT